MNQTSVGVGAVAGAIMVVVWWVISETTNVNAPEPVIAASVTLATALLQFIIPNRPGKRTRKTDV